MKAVILAGGKGKRMNSSMPKVLFKICGQTLIEHVVQNARETNINNIAVVTGYKGEMIKACLGDSVTFYEQHEQLGTANAVYSANDFFKDDDEPVLVLCGDAPLVDSVSITALIDYYFTNSLDMCVLSAVLDDPVQYGRIIRENNEFKRITEYKDASGEELLINEINSGTMIFSSGKLKQALCEIDNNNAQGEYYLTDSVEIFKSKGWRIGAYCVNNPDVVLGANDRYDLYLCESAMRKKINRELMVKSSVRMIDSATTYIDRNVQIGEGCTIYPNTTITSGSSVKNNNIIRSSFISSSEIGSDNVIDTAVIEDSVIASGCNIGPFSHLRKGTNLSDNTKIGSFAETKNASIGKNSKVPHLSYVGDASVGERCNFGCGSVVANYDGVNKYHTQIGDDVFIGCNVNMIAPIEIENGAFIAAGSTVSKNIEKDAFIIERSKPVKLNKALLKQKK